MERPRSVPPAEFRFRVRLRTRWCDEDNQRVLNNAVYLTLFEEARLAYFTQLGFVRGNQFPFLLAQTNVLFVAPGQGGVEVELAARTVELGTTSFTQCYRVCAAAGGALWAEAEARLVLYDPASGAKRPMEPAFRRAIEELETGRG
jgi:acyl-CoA thioester hydrolase